MLSRNLAIGYWLAGSLSFDQTVAFTIESSKSISTTALKNSGLSDWSSRAGDSALRQVQVLASKVAESTAAGEGAKMIKTKDKMMTKSASKMVQGIGGAVYNNPEFNRNMDDTGEYSRNVDDEDDSIVTPNLEMRTGGKREDQVWVALANLELDSK
jgi:hypothetical protein